MDLNIFRLINEVVEMVNDVRSTKTVSPLSCKQNDLNDLRFFFFF